MQAMRQVVAFGGGGFSQESGNPLLDDYVLGLTGTASPRVCFLPTASGDADHYLVRFYNAFRDRARPSHVSLFRRERGVSDIRSHLLAQDLIYVGGGSLISLLGVWRAHGIDSMLRDAYEAGVILCGLSAGLALLVRRSAERIPRRGQPRARARLPPPLECRPLRRRGPTGRVPSPPSGRDAGGIRRRGRGRPALRRRRAGRGRRLPPGGRARTSWSGGAARCWRPGWRPGTSVPRSRPPSSRSSRRAACLGGPSADPRPRRARFRPPGGQRRDLRPDRRARRRRRGLGSACCRPRAATPRTRSPASGGPSPSGTASPR